VPWIIPLHVNTTLDGDGGNVTLVGLRVQDGPPGLIELVSETVPLKPFNAVTDIVDVPGVLIGVTIVVGFPLNEKSCTFTVTGTL
jgi:hypothetical protein